MADWRLRLAARPMGRRLLFAGAVTAVALIKLFRRPAAARAVRMRGVSQMTGHDFSFTAIEGDALPLGQYRGRPMLIVNTASFCGFTPQYEGLQALWERHRERGLVVIGVPCNDFGEQEPGNSGEIREFCNSYAVSFPLTERVGIVGADRHPFYRWVAAELGEDFLPRWNFHKYLIDRQGALVGAWPSEVEPEAAEIRTAIAGVL